MINQIQNNQLATNNLTETVQKLSHSLSAIQPDNSRTTQLVTYMLVGTVVAGIFVYHYIKSQEDGEPFRLNLNFNLTGTN